MIKIKKTKSASALILTMFIMAGMLIVAISGSYIVTLGIKAGGIQAQSTKAYFVAESGAERLLWEMRKGVVYMPETQPDPREVIFSSDEEPTSLSAQALYQVFHIADFQLLYRSVGDFGNTKRSVELSM